MTKRPSTICSRMMNLILEKSPSAFTEDEKKHLLEHLAECESCQALQDEITGLHQTFSVPADSPLKPIPEIRKKAHARLKSLRPSFRATLNKRFQDLLKIRVPAYQAAFGLIILAITFSIIHGRRPSATRPSMNRKASYRYSQNSPLTDHRLAVLDSAQTFKIGRNILEDSVLFGIATLSITERDMDSSTMDTVQTDSL
jgi:predicted anti-sigma-YlaC factor YlaD